MPIRDPWAVGTSTFDAEEIRVAEAAAWTPATDAVKALTGIRPGPGNPGGVTASATPDGLTHVAPFAAIVQCSRAANAGVYTVTSDTVADVNHLGGTYGSPAHATNSRNDLVILYIPDTFYGDANSTPVIRPVIGTPSGSPADPSLSAYPGAITLARVRVSAAATTITTANITDLRPVNTVALGGLLPTATATTRNALTGVYDGMQIYRRDRDWVEVYDGAAWRVQGVATVSSVGDLTAVTNPGTGQLAHNTGDGRVYWYTGSVWSQIQNRYQASVVLTVAAPTITFSAIPTILRTIQINGRARCTVAASYSEVNFRINGDTTTSYQYVRAGRLFGAVTYNEYVAQTAAVVGLVPAGGSGVGIFGSFAMRIEGWDMAGSSLPARGDGGFVEVGGGAACQMQYVAHYSGASPYTSITLAPAAGSTFTAGTSVTLVGD